MLKPNLRRTLKPTLNRFMGGGSPVVNYVARLDGISQYWQLSGGGVSIPAGGRMEFNFIAPSDNYGSGAPSFFDNIDRRRFRVLGSNYDIFGCTIFIDGLQVNSGDVSTTDGLTHSVRVTGNLSISTFGAGYQGRDGSMMPLPLLNLSVYDENDTIINQIPLTNKDQGATQIATVGSVNATMINYTPDVWEVYNANS